VVKSEPHALDVEGLRGIDIGDWDTNDLKLHVHVLPLLCVSEVSGAWQRAIADPCSTVYGAYTDIRP
jgi:hypothetical protein